MVLSDPERKYVSGDIISGRLLVEIVDKPLELRAIRVTFKGKGKVEWTEFKGDEVEDRKRKEVIFKHVVVVFGKGMCAILLHDKTRQCGKNELLARLASHYAKNKEI